MHICLGNNSSLFGTFLMGKKTNMIAISIAPLHQEEAGEDEVVTERDKVMFILCRLCWALR